MLQIHTKTTFTALLLLALAVVLPACDTVSPIPCDPNKEICPYTGGHPDTLDPG